LLNLLHKIKLAILPRYNNSGGFDFIYFGRQKWESWRQKERYGYCFCPLPFLYGNPQ
jgi:hypothetical protein